ncbi:MAG: C45 family peptidase [Dongiaceae bacterium]
MSGSAIPVVALHGAPPERGRQHGRRFRTEIAGALATMRAARGSGAYETARRHAAAILPAIALRAPEIAAELSGIAAGAECDPVDVLLRSGFELFGVPAVAGCSAIAVGTPSGALVAQNWDAPLSFAPELVLFLHFGPDGFEQAIIGSFGALGWVGCNRYGLAFVNNDLMLSTTVPGLPSQVIRRLILRERSVPAALDALQVLPHMAGRSYLLGDATGSVAGIEVAAHIGVRIAQHGSPALHTNHALDRDVAADESAAELQATYPSSRHRYEVLRRKLPAQPDAAAIASLLADEEGYPDSISKATSSGEPSATLFSVIFECGTSSLLLCPGAPAHHPYQRIAW